MTLDDFSIRAKLLAGFAFILAIAALVSAFGISNLRQVDDANTLLSEKYLPGIKATHRIRIDLANLRIARLGLMLTDEKTPMPTAIERVEQARDALDAAVESAAGSFANAEEGELFRKIRSELQNYAETVPPQLQAARRGELDQVKAIIVGPAAANYRVVNKTLDALVAINDRDSDAAQQTAHAVYRRGRIELVLGLAAMMSVGLATALYLSGSLARRARSAVAYARRIAEGDLTHAHRASGKDELAQLLQALETTRRQLHAMVESVRRNAHSVAMASTEIAQGNHDLSGRTESQASALEETSASMEQLDSTVRQNADSAAQANRLAEEASAVAAQGGRAVEQVVATMKGIDASSQRIADIIGAIDGIAFQTNILALNAAVEAARAGEQGRGFAVVASEVRSLAGRSAEAAKEIKQLIGASVDRVAEGTVQVDRAGSTLREVVTAIGRVTATVAEISRASREQSAGVSQVGEAVMQMDRTTQQNAALVEQMAAAASSLQKQADDLVRGVSVFRLDDAAAAEARLAGPGSPGSPAARLPGPPGAMLLSVRD